MATLAMAHDHALDCHIVALGAAARETNLFRICPYQPCCMFSGVLDMSGNAAPRPVGRRGIAELLPKEREHGLAYLGPDGSGRVMVKVYLSHVSSLLRWTKGKL